MYATVKSWTPERIKGPILAALQPRHDNGLEQYRGRQKAIVTLAGFYQNLGDMALTYAQKQFIEHTLPEHEVVLFSSLDTYRRMKALKSICEPGDLITTIAGGNMDDVYASLEDARRYVVRSFPANPVISFPQTMAFSDTPSGHKRLRRSRRTYAHHKRLTIFGREPETLHRLEVGFPETPALLCPDIVLSLQLDNPPTKRAGVFICLRSDKEAKLTPRERDTVVSAVREHHSDVTVGDTVDVALEDCTPDRYEATLERFWDMLRHREVVVTDRLHCMIFCAITMTPCVVLPNSNHKVEGVYKAWLKGAPFITYLEGFQMDALIGAVAALKRLDLTDIPPIDLSDKFDPLRDAVRDAAKRQR